MNHQKAGEQPQRGINPRRQIQNMVEELRRENQCLREIVWGSKPIPGHKEEMERLRLKLLPLVAHLGEHQPFLLEEVAEVGVAEALKWWREVQDLRIAIDLGRGLEIAENLRKVSGLSSEAGLDSVINSISSKMHLVDGCERLRLKLNEALRVLQS